MCQTSCLAGFAHGPLPRGLLRALRFGMERGEVVGGKSASFPPPAAPKRCWDPWAAPVLPRPHPRGLHPSLTAVLDVDPYTARPAAHGALPLPHHPLPGNAVSAKTHHFPPVPLSGEIGEALQGKAERTVNGDGRNRPRTTFPAVTAVVY